MEVNNIFLFLGGFEKEAKVAFEDGFIPLSQKERVLPPDWDHFHDLLDELLKRVPALRSARLDRLTNALQAFSPDCKWIMGEAPEIQNYYVSAGMKTIGVSAAGGIGRALADVIVKGSTELDIHILDIKRFLGLHNNRKFLTDRVKEVPGKHYQINYPFDEFKTGRNLRMSPIYPSLKEAGAVFGQTMGYERPNYFDQHDKKGNSEHTSDITDFYVCVYLQMSLVYHVFALPKRKHLANPIGLIWYLRNIMPVGNELV